jgi:hypothetical protein
MNEKRLQEIVESRFRAARMRVTVQQNVGVIWHLSATPTELPPAKYTGMIMMPGTPGCVVFSISKRDQKFYDKTDLILHRWVNPEKTNYRPNLHWAAYDNTGSQIKLRQVRLESGVDTMMEI